MAKLFGKLRQLFSKEKHSTMVEESQKEMYASARVVQQEKDSESEERHYVRCAMCSLYRERDDVEVISFPAFFVWNDLSVLAFGAKRGIYPIFTVCRKCVDKLIDFELKFVSLFVPVVDKDSVPREDMPSDYELGIAYSWLDLLKYALANNARRIIRVSTSRFLVDCDRPTMFSLDFDRKLRIVVPAVIGITAFMCFCYEENGNYADICCRNKQVTVDLREFVRMERVVFSGDFERLRAHFEKAAELGLCGKIDAYTYVLSSSNFPVDIFRCEELHPAIKRLYKE